MLWAKGIGEYVEAAKIINVEFQILEVQLLYLKNKWIYGIVNYLGTSDNVREISKVLPSYYREGTPRILLVWKNL